MLASTMTLNSSRDPNSARHSAHRTMSFLIVGPWITKAREPHLRHCNPNLSLRGMAALQSKGLNKVLGQSVELSVPAPKSRFQAPPLLGPARSTTPDLLRFLEKLRQRAEVTPWRAKTY